MKNTILGFFKKLDDVELAVDELLQEGYGFKDLSILMKKNVDREDVTPNPGANIAEGILSGMGAGLTLGGLAALLAGIIIPQPGAFLIGIPAAEALNLTGIAAGILSGGLTGALAGGIFGAFLGIIFSKEEERLYEEYIKQDFILLAVQSEDWEKINVESILLKHGVMDIKLDDGVYENSEDTEKIEITTDEPYRWFPNHDFSDFSISGVKGGKAKNSIFHTSGKTETPATHRKKEDIS